MLKKKFILNFQVVSSNLTNKLEFYLLVLIIIVKYFHILKNLLKIKHFFLCYAHGAHYFGNLHPKDRGMSAKMARRKYPMHSKYMLLVKK